MLKCTELPNIKTLSVHATQIDTIIAHPFIKENVLKTGVRTVAHRAQIITINLPLRFLLGYQKKPTRNKIEHQLTYRFQR